MKKLLLSLFMISSSFAYSQILQSEDFNSLTVGDIGTDLTGVTPGQGGWLTFNSTGGTNSANSNYQIVVEGGDFGNVFQFTGSNGATGNKFMWKSGLPAVWADRTPGNNIIEVEFDYFTGPTTSSLNSFRVYIYSAEASPKVLAGMGIAKNATISALPFTNVVSGFAHWTSTPGTGTYSFGLGPATTSPIVLPVDTWVRMGFSFNVTTGEVKWKGPGFDASFTGSEAFPVVTAGLEPGEIDFIAIAGTGNTVASVSKFDNYVAKASNTDTLLSVDGQNLVSNAISAYPNPTKDKFVVDTNNESQIKAIVITDLNGRVVKNVNFENVASTAQVDISDLNLGVYFLTITTDLGVGTSKIIKN